MKRSFSPPMILTLILILTNFYYCELDDPSTLFRSNSKASKLLSASLRACAVDYLRQVVGDVILRICTTLPSVEIDPNRLFLLDCKQLIFLPKLIFCINLYIDCLRDKICRIIFRICQLSVIPFCITSFLQLTDVHSKFFCLRIVPSSSLVIIAFLKGLFSGCVLISTRRRLPNSQKTDK